MSTTYLLFEFDDDAIDTQGKGKTFALRQQVHDDALRVLHPQAALHALVDDDDARTQPRVATVTPSYTMPDYYPSLEVAAAIAGVGPRTLQRRLAQFGLTYSELVKQVRLEGAIQMLHDPKKKIIDIAYNLGYGDPSHFTRAFRRIVGTSPREFRRRLCSAAQSVGLLN